MDAKLTKSILVMISLMGHKAFGQILLYGCLGWCF